MRGLLFAILFCALSLLFAEAFTTLLTKLSLIHPNEFDDAHNLIMSIMVVIYMVFAPTFTKDFKDHNHEDDRKW